MAIALLALALLLALVWPSLQAVQGGRGRPKKKSQPCSFIEVPIFAAKWKRVKALNECSVCCDQYNRVRYTGMLGLSRSCKCKWKRRRVGPQRTLAPTGGNFGVRRKTGSSAARDRHLPGGRRSDPTGGFGARPLDFAVPSAVMFGVAGRPGDAGG